MFNEEKWPEGDCPNLSEKGKNIPMIRGDVKPRPINAGSRQTNYSLMYRKGNTSFFWIPVEYLP